MPCRNYVLACLMLLVAGAPSLGDEERLFETRVAPILEQRCLSCHNDGERKGDLSLENARSALDGGESGQVLLPGDPDASLLLEYVQGETPLMPKDDEPLAPEEVAALRQWIAAGAAWPEQLRLADKRLADNDWWSLRPLDRPVVPQLGAEDWRRVRTAVDVFVLARLRARGLTFSPEADRRTLIRRLYFDLIGLPPTPDEVNTFVQDEAPHAYERLVDRLLASPGYGERWARHWLDVVHYGDTHGYDKDKLRPNAWPYRDYVIRSFNSDKPYGRFIQEQLAGDVLWPETTDGIVATGFIAAGPWDFIGHAEVPETKIDGQVARHLDRDDMVSTTCNALLSMTVQCAQCHNHKFDPVTQEQYYSLQAVFAALDRADRPYEISPEVGRRRRALEQRIGLLETQLGELQAQVRESAGVELARLDEQIDQLNKQQAAENSSEAYGYHSRIMSAADHEKWVQVDLGEPVEIEHVVYVGCWDAFNNIFHGFGFPVRYKIEVSNDSEFQEDVRVVVDHTRADVANPGTRPQTAKVGGAAARFVRVTATRLAPRQNDFIFALAELMVLDGHGVNAARGKPVTALDSIEAPVRWAKKNLVDGYYYHVQAQDQTVAAIARLDESRQALIEQTVEPVLRHALEQQERTLKEARAQLAALPAQGLVYAGTIHHGEGSFRGTGARGGKPREIRVLRRGNVTQPAQLVGPGVLPLIPGVDWQFELPADHEEGERRVALARWITRADNPLTWRSIVNRVWQYHFGRGLVETSNDFGRMGALPTHPELLDWLAVEFRDRGQSIKHLHRLLVCSATYRQGSGRANEEASAALERDAENRLLWRMDRRKLEAEAIRDTVLYAAGKLDRKMGGPGFQDFVLERPEHSPHYEYHKHDPDDPATHRRSIYRFLVRSQPQPFMLALDCADPSQLVERRNETLTALQALTLLNNKFMLRMSAHFAQRLEQERGDLPGQVRRAFRLALSREPADGELRAALAYARQFGLANTCRVILNLNEFTFVD